MHHPKVSANSFLELSLARREHLMLAHQDTCHIIYVLQPQPSTSTAESGIKNAITQHTLTGHNMMKTEVEENETNVSCATGVAKSSTERSRAYRKRLKLSRQNTRHNISTVQPQSSTSTTQMNRPPPQTSTHMRSKFKGEHEQLHPEIMPQILPENLSKMQLFGDNNVEIPHKLAGDYYNTRQLKRQLRDKKTNSKKSKIPVSPLHLQPSTSTAQIHPEQQDDMHTNDICQKSRVVAPIIDKLRPSQLVTMPLDNDGIRSRSLTQPKDGKSRQEEQQPQPDYQLHKRSYVFLGTSRGKLRMKWVRSC